MTLATAGQAERIARSAIQGAVVLPKTCSKADGPRHSFSPRGPGIPLREASQFGHDFGRVFVVLPPQAASNRSADNSPSLRFVPLAPRPDKRADPPAPAAKAGVAELYITVRRPAAITSKAVLATDPFAAPSAVLSFQLARHAKFKQDEFVVGHLQWSPAGKRQPPSEQEEEFNVFTHSWTSDTTDRPDLPGSPIMLRDTDTHTWGLAIVPGLDCEGAAKKHRPPFDRLKDDWTFEEHAKFIDTVTFPDREIKRVYYFYYRCTTMGGAITADVEYTNVDKVETF